jgi:hypothetical protein
VGPCTHHSSAAAGRGGGGRGRRGEPRISLWSSARSSPGCLDVSESDGTVLGPSVPAASRSEVPRKLRGSAGQGHWHSHCSFLQVPAAVRARGLQLLTLQTVRLQAPGSPGENLNEERDVYFTFLSQRSGTWQFALYRVLTF